MIVTYKVEIDIPESVLFDPGYAVGRWSYRNAIVAAMKLAGEKKADQFAEEISSQEKAKANGQMDIYDYAETTMA